MKPEKQHIRQELEEMGSDLSSLLDKSSMKVPEGYFEQLEQVILNKTVLSGNIETGKREGGKTIGLHWFKYAASIAAVFTLVFFGMKLFKNKNETSFEVQLAAMSESELENYMNGQIEALTASDLNVFINDHINEIDAGMLAETKLIDEESANNQLNKEVNLQILSDEDLNTKTKEPLLDKKLLEQIDDETIEQLLNDESMYDDFAL